MAGVNIRVDMRAATDTFAETAEKLRRARAGLGTWLRDEMRKAARPVRAELRAEFQAVNMTSKLMGGGHPSYSRNLRGRVAAATDFTVTQNAIAFYVDVDQVDERYGARLAGGVNGKRWVHPVFGRAPNEWEQGSREVFAPTIEGNDPAFTRACDRAAQNAFRMMS